MVIGVCSIKFYLHDNRSLKGKRRVTRAIKDRLKNNFNASVAEVGDQDNWRSLQIGISAVSSDRAYMDGLMEKVVNVVDRMDLAEIVDSKIETLNLGSDNF